MNASSASSSNTNNSSTTRAKELISKYFHQLTVGCESDQCDNENCAKNKNFKKLSNDEAAAKALSLAKSKAVLCKQLSVQQKKMKKSNSGDVEMKNEDVDDEDEERMDHEGNDKSINDQLQDVVKFLSKSMDLPTTSHNSQSQNDNLNQHPSGSFLTDEKLKILLDKCTKSNNYNALIDTLDKAFHNFNLLSISFNLKQPSNDRDLNEINLDLDSLKRSLRLINQTLSESDAELLDECLNKNVNNLLNLIKFILTNKKQFYDESSIDEINNILHSLLIINELPLIDNPKYLDTTVKLFYKTIGDLPDCASVKLIRIWSKLSDDELKMLLHRTQQFITLSIMNNLGEYVASESFNSNESDVSTLETHTALLKYSGIQGACNYLRYIYYASIFGGRLDLPVTIERERKEELEDISYFQQQHQLQQQQNMDQSQQNEFINETTTNKLDIFEELLNVRAIDCRKPKIEFDLFINELANKFIYIQHDYIEYKQQQQALYTLLQSQSSNVNIANLNLTHIRMKNFSFLSYPFFLTLTKKNLGLYYDNKIKMIRERRNNIVLSLLEGVLPMPYIKIRIKRNNVLAEALNLIELQEEDNIANLRKQLFVEFENEQGIDEGGVSKEFFQLAIDELLNKGYTFFTFDEKSRYYWFNPCTLESEKEFKLLGILFGIAIYNNVLLDVLFPPVFFRKLMGKVATLEDLKESHLVLYQSMKSLLDYEGDDFEEVFMLTHQVSFNDTFGSAVPFNILDNGDAIPVTRDNRKRFVDLYADFILNKSIEDKFNAFRRGFMSVFRNSPLLKWYLPEELEILLCGSKVLDWKSLESSTNYDGGFTSDHEAIKTFWSIFNEFTDEQKKLFLKFTTGTDRCPHGGLSELKLMIARNGPDTEKLPTAHTCFNVLLLPEYSTKQKLKEKLLKAIQYAHGFGLS